MLFRALILSLAAGMAGARSEILLVTPLPVSTSYATGKDRYGALAGTHQGIKTAGWKGTPTQIIRPLGIQAETALNRGPSAAAETGPGMPPVFGGFFAEITDSPLESKYTVRLQIQDGREKRPDYLNFLLYLENPSPMPAGISYRFRGAMLVPAGDNGTESLVDLPSILEIVCTSTPRGPAATTRRAVVHDAESGRFYVSEALTADAQGSLVIRGTKWAELHEDNLAMENEFNPPAFKWVDYMGVYYDTQQRKTENETKSFGQICELTLQSIAYKIELP